MAITECLDERAGPYIRSSGDHISALSTANRDFRAAPPRESWRIGPPRSSFLAPGFGRGRSAAKGRDKSEIPSRIKCTGSSPPRTLLRDAGNLHATDNGPA